MDRKENQPKRFIGIALAMMKHRRFQRVEEAACRVGAQRADVPRTDKIDILYSVDAFNNLLNQSCSVRCSVDARQPNLFLIERLQRSFKLSRKLLVLGSHESTVAAARVIQRRMASLTWVVTPKLL